ncbi:MAG: heme exporter protein CcmB [Aaplasma endosymbiont of Hyalomma asiaticum]
MQELRVIACRGSSSVHVAILFAVLVGTALFVLPHECAKKSMTCIFWVCSVSVMQISMRAMFEEDYRSGILEQLLIQDILPEVMVTTKILAHWLGISVPICAVSMITDFVVFGDSIYQVLGLGTTLCATLLVVNFVSSVGHTLVLGGEGGLVIAQLLTFPIVIPIAIYFDLLLQMFGGAVSSAHLYLMILLGVGMICLIPISVLFVLSAIKLAVEQN